MDTLYIEQDIADHPRTRAIAARYPKARQVSIERHSEVFNAPGQDFRVQKQAPALILAGKHGNRVLPTPPGYHIGGKHNYYFSHMLNCIYDCRYCFLQGLYRSGNYVVFVNFDDFFDDIETQAAQHAEPSWYFSGYDCDSLALEPVTGFVSECLDRFEVMPSAWLELRTKSTQVRHLLNRPPLDNCVIAYSLSPEPVVTAEEHRTPSLAKRIAALAALQKHGWRIGLRFDPLLAADNFQNLYGGMFESVFATLDCSTIHSVSLGPFRLPKAFHKRMVRLYPGERLLATATETRAGMVSYPAQREADMLAYCEDTLLKQISLEQYFPCVAFSGTAA